jgi:curved DNA-binding protein CbpA
VEARDGSLNRDFEVVHCERQGTRFRVGFEFRKEADHRAEPPAGQIGKDGDPDYYEILQINRKADSQTIHRVFRIMAARFHPDNPETGDVEQFLRMNHAYAVLSNPERRTQYDATLEKSREAGPKAIFALKDFVTGVEAESNRRLGVLSLLYHRRQTSPEHPGISLLDLEREMGFPREYLSFTMWYLHAKQFVTVGDDSNYGITASGADYVEKKALRNEMVDQLLNPGAPHVHRSGKGANRFWKSAHRPKGQRLLPSSPTKPGID